MILLVDVGNTRIKWACAVSGGLSEHASIERDEVVPGGLLNAWSQLPSPKRIVVASVSRDAVSEHIQYVAQQLWDLDIEFVEVQAGLFGIDLAYAQPELLGVDRWLAMIAASREIAGPLMVVSSGTALTVDVLSADHTHLGGVIVPGMALMTTALSDRAAGISHGLAHAERGQDSAWLGRDTPQCVELGGLYALAGTIERLYERAQKEMGITPSVIIAGGDADSLSVELGIDTLVAPDLVLRGMQLLIGES